MNFDYEKMVVSDLTRWNQMFGGGVPTKADIEAAMRGEVDPDTLQRMRSYTHSLERRTVVDECFTVYPEEWSFEEFRALMGRLVASIPEDKRHTAKIELTGGYDESTYLRASYERDQTDDEWASDVAHALMHARKGQADDLRIYNRLKAKFTADQ